MEGRALRVLTVKQPWASLIALGIKRVENRTWAPSKATLPDGSRIAIHAGGGWDARGAKRVGCQLDRRTLPSGLILCTAVVERIAIEMDDLYFVGPLGWVLRDVRPALSRPLRGQLGLWKVADEEVVEIQL
jgi:hypothetical protein